MTTEPLNRHLVAEGRVNFNYKFSEDKTTLTVDGVEYTKGADGKYTRTEKVGNKTTTYTVTVNEEELKDDDTIKAMLAKEFHIDASKDHPEGRQDRHLYRWQDYRYHRLQQPEEEHPDHQQVGGRVHADHCGHQ